MLKEAYYLHEQINLHIKRFFNLSDVNFFDKIELKFAPYYDCVNTKTKSIVIPVDISASSIFQDIYKVDFNQTQVTLYNRIPKPENWIAIPNDTEPVWYINENKTLMPAWNLFQNLFSLLTLKEEISSEKRDSHDRFIAEFSPRLEKNLLEVPVFNEACALLVAAAIGLETVNTPNFYLDNVIKKPFVVYSHDNDIILGNDKWTQMVRLYRFLKPVAHLKLPEFSNLKYFIVNASHPKAYYYNNILGMIDLERMHNSTSSFYFINGSFGRFGARSRLDIIPEIYNRIPEGWNVGMHYNYNTLLNKDLFYKQKSQLEKILGKNIVCGRAHYLRFNPEHSFQFLDDMGMKYDESVGYPDKIGYRCGIAGPFNPYDPQNNKKLDITEMPLTIMDSTLIEQYHDDPIKAFQKLLLHLDKIGGAVSILFHPGMFYNPEFPEAIKVYLNLQEAMYEMGATGTNCVSLIDSINKK